MSMRMRVFAFTTLAAGAVLLTACSEPGSAAGAEKSGSAPASTTSTSSTATLDPADSTESTDSTESGGGDLQPVECGPVEVDSLGTHMLVAQPSVGGVVGCTEAFNVIDEYLQIPSAERSASFEGTPLSAGWTCSTDDGETLSIGCVKGKNGDDWDFAFSTTPVDK